MIARLLKISSLGNLGTFYESDYIRERDILFENSGLADRMLKLLKRAELPENIYRMEYLDTIYQKFSSKDSMLFSLQEMFDEGWLIACSGEWTFNVSNQYLYEKVDHLLSEKETQIFSFLKELSGISYRSKRWFRISEQEDYKESADILEIRDDGIFLKPHGKPWSQFGNAILGKWWDEIFEMADSEEEKNRQIERWFLCWEFLECCQKPDCFCEHVQELFEICLEKLEIGLNNISWNLMEKILRRRLYLEYNLAGKLRYDDLLQDFPDMLAARLLYIESECSFFDLLKPFQRLSIFCQLCMRQYGRVDENMRMRLRQGVQNPLGYIYFYCLTGNTENIRFVIDCLGDAGLYMIAASVIWGMCYTLITEMPSIGEKILDELNQNLFHILEHGLEWRNREEWLFSIKDLTWYLNKKSIWYCKNENINKNGTQRYMQYICTAYLSWYRVNISNKASLHEDILEYFCGEFENSSERDVVGAFAQYTILLGMQNTEEKKEKLFETYQKFLKRVQIEDTLVSVLTWSFWLEGYWISMMREVASSKKECDVFLKLLKPDFYKKMADVQEEESPRLKIGMAAIIQMYFITILFLEVRGEIAEKYRIKVETAFVECFVGFQIEQCDLFDPESIRILESEIVIRRCMEILPMLHSEKRAKILSEMKKESSEKLIFLSQYILNPDFRKQWIQILLQRHEEDFAKNIFYIPTYKQIIDCLMELCFQGEDEKQVLLDKTREMLGRFQQIIKEKGPGMEKQYKAWMESARLRIKILMHEDEAVLFGEKSSSSTFYRALLYLNRMDLDSLKKSEELYRDYIDAEDTDKSNAVYINYFAACVRICTHMETTEEEKVFYLQKAESIAKKVHENLYLSLSDQKILFSNELFLYTVLNDNLKFWKSVSYLPPELKYELSCAKYIVYMLILGKEVQKAEEYLDELVLRYGMIEEIKQLRKKVGETVGTLEQDVPAYLPNETTDIEKYRNVLNRIKNLLETESALVRLQKDQLENPEEANLLEFVLNASQKMEQYSDYLVYESKVPHENVYSKFIQILFNQRGKEIWDFYLMDQTLEGTAYDRKQDNYQSVGVVDLFIYHDNRPTGIIETIKLRGTEYNDIKAHIQKIHGYNYANVPTVFLLILADMSNPGKFWEKYEKDILPSIIKETKDNDWHITEYVSAENIELVKQKLICKPLYLCMTSHTCDGTNHTLHLYHIMVDIKKAAAKKEAVDARKGKQS